MRLSFGAWLLELVAVGLIVVADQATKRLVVAELPLHESVTVVPGLLNLTHVRNTGAAFGLMNSADFAHKPLVIGLFAGAALIGVAAYAAALPRGHLLARTALALILGGALGNLVDRARQGYVVDFVDAHWRSWHFWAFNVADAAITIGVVLMILDSLRPARPAAAADRPSEA